MLFELGGTSEGQYDVIIRSINSKDARTAAVTNLPFELLTDLKEKILRIAGTKQIYFDLTPNPQQQLNMCNLLTILHLFLLLLV